jgi:hypothetical protein
MTESNPETAPEKAPKASDDGKRFAVYDLTYERFVGPVTGKRPSKANAEKAAGHDNVEIREV